MNTLVKRSLIVLLATSAMVSGLSTVNAVEPQLDSVVSTNPENHTPNINDGRVNAMVQVGDRVIAVGKFTSVTAAASAGGATTTRNSIFAFDAATGVIDETFIPDVGTKEVFDIVDAGDGTVYIGGLFSSVNGAANTGKVARLDAATGAVIATFKSPKPNVGVTDMHLINARLYIGGGFTALAGKPRSLLAALNPDTGADTGSVALNFTDTWNGGSLSLKHLDISDDGRTLVAVGNWRNVNGESRPQIVMLDLSGPTAVLSNWATQRFTSTCASAFDTYLRDVDIAPDGDYFVVVTTGAYAGGAGSGTLCDAISRWELDATGLEQHPSWVDYSGGDTITQAKVVGDVIYVGGHFRWFNNPYAGDSAGPGATARTGLAAVDPRNGLPLSWNPTRDRGVGVWDFLTTDAGLWVGHDSNRTGKEARKRLALFPTTATVPPVENTGSLPGGVYLLGANWTDQVQRRDFDGVAVSAASTVPSTTAWSGARGAFMIDGVLYTGWADGTLQRRSFDGTDFGAPSPVNLNGLTGFAADLPAITAMFYDRETARLYYTQWGQPGLFYRYFLPESQVVGAVKFSGPAGGDGLDLGKAAGMFLDNGRLYVADRDSGQLRSVAWARGEFNGPATVVSGPTLDGHDWRARGSFILAP